MATGVIRNLPIQASAPAYFPMIYQRSPCREDEDEKLQEEPEEREDEEEEEEEEEDEEEECLSHYALDVTKQLLRFADLISRDVQRYFGRDHEACDIYSDSVSTTTSGRLRYYDDLLRIAGSPEEQETHAEDAKGSSSSLGPLAELFDHRGPSQSRGQPMIKRHLPLSFWTEPMPCSSPVSSSNTPDNTHTHHNHNTHTHYNHNTHTLDGAQPDFSDLLANWDPNPDLGHTLTENSHMQQ